MRGPGRMLAQRGVGPGQRDLGTREVQGPRGAGLEVPGGPASLCFHKKIRGEESHLCCSGGI